jgi:peptidyl-prolyl cis-trans isomerase D
MFEKMYKYMHPKTGRGGQGFTWKNWVAYILFGAIIIVFALFGMDRNSGGQDTGGVAAVVNHETISLAEFRQRVESKEQNSRMGLDQFPEAQRRMFNQKMKKEALDELILGELVYQAAVDRGVIAADAEVREYIRQIPILQENGRFQNERYRMFLQQMNLTAADFERQVRKQLVTQKLQDLFVGSATPSREELKRNRLLANQKVNVRFAEVKEDELGKLLSDADVKSFLESKKAEIEKYYNENKIEFTTAETVKARHILIRPNDKRTDDQAKKLAEDLRAKATPANFAALAAKNSDDPGSKAKGGDLGEFGKGRMVPAFEQAAFALKPGEISPVVKSDFGYHIIYVEKKNEAKTETLAEASPAIARKLLIRGQGGDAAGPLKKTVEAGNKKELDAELARAGVKWQETGEFDLSSNQVPKLGESPELMSALLKHGPKGGLVQQVVPLRGGFVVAEILSWKESPDKTPDVDGLERMVAFRKSSDLIETWARDVQAKANIQRNPRLLQ